MPATEAPEAPTAAPVAAPAADTSGFHDATGEHEVWEFPTKSETAEAPAAPAPSEPTEPATPEPAAPPATAPEADELSDDLIEKVLRHPNGQKRVDQLVNGKLGNRLQQERATWAQEQKQDADKWDTASAYHDKLAADDDFYEAQVKEHGEDSILEFRANYIRAAKARATETPAQAPAPDLAKLQTEFAHEFNTAAVGEFQRIAKATLPFYGDLPADVRARIDGAAYDPAGNWLADSLTALGQGVEKHIAQLNRAHAQALKDATEAGRNDAHAERQDAAPLVVNGADSGFDPHEIIRRYGLMDTSVTRGDYHKALRLTGQSI
jgi:hypothetical protein